jgi:hypothetical protein
VFVSASDEKIRELVERERWVQQASHRFKMRRTMLTPNAACWTNLITSRRIPTAALRHEPPVFACSTASSRHPVFKTGWASPPEKASGSESRASLRSTTRTPTRPGSRSGRPAETGRSDSPRDSVTVPTPVSEST